MSAQPPAVSQAFSVQLRAVAPPVSRAHAVRSVRWPWRWGEAREAWRLVAAIAARRCAGPAAVLAAARPAPRAAAPTRCRRSQASRSSAAGNWGGRMTSRRSPAANHETAVVSGVFHGLCGQNAKCVRVVRMPQHRGEITASMCRVRPTCQGFSQSFAMRRNSLSGYRSPAEHRPVAK